MPERRRHLPNWATNLLLAATAVALTLVAAEIAVRLFVDLRELKPTGIHGVDPDEPIRFLPQHERVYETSEFRYTVSFNRFGRRDVEWSDATLADPRNVLFIGDSFVLGNGVEHEETIPTRLEKRLGAREVFNFGMPAGGPRTYGLLLEDALASGLAAQTVIVGTFVGNDFYPSVLMERPLVARRSQEAEPGPPRGPRSELLQFLKLRLSTSTRVVGWALDLSSRLGITIYDTAGSYIFLRRPTYDQRVLFDRVLEQFGRIQEVAEEHGRELRIVIFPNRLQVENREDLTNAVFEASRPNDRILEYCRERGIACLDLLPVLSSRYDRNREPLYFPIDRHLNETGTRVAADAIASFLRETGALP